MKNMIPLACSVCFGDPNSSMTKGAMMGVLFLLGVVLFVLGAIASVAVVWTRRARPEALASGTPRKPRWFSLRKLELSERSASFPE